MKKIKRKEYPIKIISGPTGTGLSTTLQTTLTALAKKEAGTVDVVDIVMIGEVRDENSAHLACEAMQTGHQVWHSPNVSNAVMIMERLKGLGIDYKDSCDPHMINGHDKSKLLISALADTFGVSTEQFEDVEDYILENEYLGDF